MSCEERYDECTEERQARVRQVIADNPYDTNVELAEKAGVHLNTIKRELKRLLQNGSGGPNCNKECGTIRPIPLTYEAKDAITYLSQITDKETRLAIRGFIATNW